MIFRELLIIRVTLLLLLSMASAITYAAEGDIFTLLDDSNFRRGPNSSYSSLGIVRQGEQVVELDMRGGWVKIRIIMSGDVGWLYADSLERKLATNALKDVAPAVYPKREQQPKHSPLTSPMYEDGSVQRKTELVERKKVNITQAKVTKVDVHDQTARLKKAASTASDTARNIVNTLPKTAGNIRGGMKIVMKTAIIRTGPGFSNDVLGWLGKGANVREVGRQGDWVKVRVADDGSVGWVESSIIKSPTAVDTIQTSSLPKPMVFSLKSLNETDLATGSGKMLSDTEVVQFVKKANLRGGPAKHYEVMTWAGKGSYARMLDRKGGWIQVKMRESGRIGWVYKNVLQSVSKGGKKSMATVVPDHVGTVSNMPTFPTVAASTSDSQAAMVMVDPLALELRRPIGENTTKQLSLSPIQAAVMPTRAVVKRSSVGRVELAMHDTGEQWLLTFNSKASLRAGPGLKYDVVSWAGKGSYASELARKGDWVRVQMQVSKRIGWVYKRALKKVKLGEKRISDAAVKVVEERSAVIQTARTIPEHLAMMSRKSENTSHIEHYQALRTGPLRLKPLRFAELTGWIPKGELVVLMAKQGSWMHVKLLKAEKVNGWIKSDYLEKVDASTSIPTGGKKKLTTTEPIVAYQGRISKGRDFSFSHIALEQALHKVSVENIHIRIHQADLKALFHKDENDYSSFKIRLIDGRQKLSGTIEVLGSSTRILKKKSLLIKLGKYSAPWYGRRKIALQSMATGKAMMQEWMAWKLMAAMGMKVPEVHFTRVSFNHGEKVGLYLSIEWIGKHFLAANYPGTKEALYEARAVACADWKSSKNLRRCFDKIIPPDDDYSVLSDIVKTVSSAKVGEMDAVLAKHFDDESVLNWIAVNTLVTDGDTYNKNYWLLYNPGTKKWAVLPWDYDLTFGRVYDPFINTPDKQGDPKKFYNDNLMIFNDDFQYYFPPDMGAGNPLKDKILRNPRLRARLEIKMKHLLGLERNGPKETYGWFSPTVMDARIGTLAAVVGKELYKDTFLTYGEKEFTKSYEALMHYVSARDHYLKAKLQGSYKWQPSPPFDPNAPPEPLPATLYGEGTIHAGGLSVQMTDQGWGYFVARLNLDEPLKQKTQFKVHIVGGATPKYLPTGQSPNRCIRRSWEVSTVTSGIAADGNLMVEYIQQNSKRTEVPVTLHEKLLELWMRDGSDWRLLKTEVNAYANTLIARDVHLESGHTQYFVACSPF